LRSANHDRAGCGCRLASPRDYRRKPASSGPRSESFPSLASRGLLEINSPLLDEDFSTGGNSSESRESKYYGVRARTLPPREGKISGKTRFSYSCVRRQGFAGRL